MKKSIHPKTKLIEVTCACGNVVKLESTTTFSTTNRCDKCHPFNTGKKQMLDQTGMLEKFNRRLKTNG